MPPGPSRPIRVSRDGEERHTSSSADPALQMQKKHCCSQNSQQCAHHDGHRSRDFIRYSLCPRDQGNSCSRVIAKSIPSLALTAIGAMAVQLSVRPTWPLAVYCCSRGMKPSVSVCMKATSASSSASGQTGVPDFTAVHVGGRFRRGPTRRAFASIMGLASRQDIARIVEMHNPLQAREVSVVPISLHEGGIRPLVDVAQCRHLHSRLVVGRELQPSLVHCGGLAQQMSLLEKTADAGIDE